MGNIQIARAPAIRNAATVAMANRFGKYGPMEEKAVRNVEVAGDELSYLRQRCEMLRSMTPEQAFSVIESHKGLNVSEALELAKREKKLIVPNDVHDRILTETDSRYVAWTGTAVIYEVPDKPFGEKVIFNWNVDNAQYTATFDVPQQFIGKTNCVLVVEYPDFGFVGLGDNRFQLKAAEGAVSLIEHFPKKSNEWYEYDERFRIPTGSPKKEANSTR
ncbi:hypothetical protein H0O00_00785 [Candidatus Micrarchaeota archaeon]|nr:hypothetical protein [Candidatus Micrarchaeota archaeon]